MTMLAIWILGFTGLLAQAEQAPPEPEPGAATAGVPPESVAPPATGAPAQSPSAVPAPAPAPATEPTPAPPPSPAAAEPPPEPTPAPRHTLSLLGGFAYRLAGSGSGLGPAAGFSLGGAFERRYATPAPGLELGAAVDFLYAQFSEGISGPSTNSNRSFTDTSFAALQTLGVRAGPVHLWGAVGVGLSVGYFSSPNEMMLTPSSAVAYLPFARGVAGIDVAVNDEVALGLRASYSFMFTNPTYTNSMGQTYHLFGDLLEIHAGLFYRFQ